MRLIIISAALILLVVVVVNCARQNTQCALSRDYCALCPKHVACNRTPMPSRCANKRKVQFISFTKANRRLFIKLMNGKRQHVAKGGSKFPAAARMASVEWSCELAHVAKKNVEQCKMNHDKCRSIDGNDNIGQNIYYAAKTDGHYPAHEAIRMATNAWFNEIKKTSQRDMDSLSNANVKHFMKIGHFTQMMQEKVKTMGCGMVQFMQTKRGGVFYATIITCDYGYGNMLGRPVYKKSNEPASGCKTGTHPKYSALCSSAEIYN